MTKAAPEVQEGGMALFVANFQISIALGSFVGGLIVDALGLFNAMYVGVLLAALAIIIVAAFGNVITNRQSI
jgi:predicted MFS family arabinose efflux permease